MAASSAFSVFDHQASPSNCFIQLRKNQFSGLPDQRSPASAVSSGKFEYYAKLPAVNNPKAEPT